MDLTGYRPWWVVGSKVARGGVDASGDCAVPEAPRFPSGTFRFSWAARHAVLKTKSIYAPADPRDGIRMLVTRFYPRGVGRERFHEWNRGLAPSARLLAQYRNARITPDVFVELFRAEMDTDAGRAAINSLRERATMTDITLLCYEPDGKLCHRHILYHMVSDVGVPTKLVCADRRG